MFTYNLSRNQKVLRPFVAPSVSPGSISILSRQPKLPTEFRRSLRSLVQEGSFSFSTFNLFQEVDPLKLKRGPTTLPFIACFRQSASSKTFSFLIKGKKNYKKIL